MPKVKICVVFVVSVDQPLTNQPGDPPKLQPAGIRSPYPPAGNRYRIFSATGPSLRSGPQFLASEEPCRATARHGGSFLPLSAGFLVSLSVNPATLWVWLLSVARFSLAVLEGPDHLAGFFVVAKRGWTVCAGCYLGVRASFNVGRPLGAGEC